MNTGKNTLVRCQRASRARRALPWFTAVTALILGAWCAGTGRVSVSPRRVEFTAHGESRYLDVHLYAPSPARPASPRRPPGGSALLLHGTNSAKESYRFLGMRLAAAGVRVIAADFSDDVWSIPDGHMRQARAVISTLLNDGGPAHRWATVGHSDGGQPAFIAAGLFPEARAAVLIGTLAADPALVREYGGGRQALPMLMGAVGLYDEIFYPGEVRHTLESAWRAMTTAGAELPEPDLFISPLSDHFTETLDPIILAETTSFCTHVLETRNAGDAGSLAKRYAADIMGETLLFTGIILLVSLLLKRFGAASQKRRLLVIGIVILSILSGHVIYALWPAALFFALLPFYCLGTPGPRIPRPSLASFLVLVWTAVVVNLILTCRAFWSSVPGSLLHAPGFALWQPVVLLPKTVSVLKLYAPPLWETGFSFGFPLLGVLAAVELIVPGRGAAWMERIRSRLLRLLRGPFVFHPSEPGREDLSETALCRTMTGKQIVLFISLTVLAGGLWFYRYTQGVLGMDLLLSQMRMALHTAVVPAIALVYVRITAYLRDKRSYRSDKADEV